MAFVGISSLLVCSIVVLLADGHQQIPLPYQRQYQQSRIQPYPGVYQQPSVYQPFQPFAYPQPVYPFGGYPYAGGLPMLPYGYRVEPLPDENAIVTPAVEPVPISALPAHFRFPYAKPTITVDSAPPMQYVVERDSFSTMNTNRNNHSAEYRQVQNKSFNSTIRKVFTSDGQPGTQVYTINIVNGVEVTTTEDPNAISSIANGAEELEETPTNDVKEKEDGEKEPSPIFAWYT